MLQYLAIDTGGSKTNFVVFDSEKNEIMSFKTDGFGYAVDSEEDIPILTESLLKIKNEFNISAIAVNLGGKNRNQIGRIIEKTIPEIPYEICRESEGYASAAFGKMHGANIVLLAGTGTIVTGFDNSGNFSICGGWGMNIGDQGSGYYIGLEAIKNTLEALDDNAPLSPMQTEISQRSEAIEKSDDVGSICNARDTVRSEIFPIERRKVASYAKIVAKHCESNDKNALAIMQSAGVEMAKLADRCIKKIAPYVPNKIAVSGGLCNSKKFWQKSFEDMLCSKYKNLDFIYENDGIMLGTMELAINLTK